jgi:hypothetical protein
VSLRNIPILREVVVLPGGSYFTGLDNMFIRNGDMMILYAGDDIELGELVEHREVFEEFRIILIVGEDEYRNDGRCHLLNPRYIASIHTDFAELNAVMEKMIGKSVSY